MNSMIRLSPLAQSIRSITNNALGLTALHTVSLTEMIMKKILLKTLIAISKTWILKKRNSTTAKRSIGALKPIL
jgi:hypothetical protein